MKLASVISSLQIGDTERVVSTGMRRAERHMANEPVCRASVSRHRSQVGKIGFEQGQMKRRIAGDQPGAIAEVERLELPLRAETEPAAGASDPGSAGVAGREAQGNRRSAATPEERSR